MIRALDRKLLRDLWRVKGQAFAIAAVIGAGVAMFIGFLSTFDSLRLTQAAYYERYRFADVFAGLKRAPLRTADRVAEIPGVNRVETRIVADVTLDLPDVAEPATGRLISIPVPSQPTLNDIFLRRGRFPAPDRLDEVLVNEGFALARGLEPGDRLRAVINARRRELQIVGIALSPEYIYTIRPGELVPDDERFGIFWMNRRALAAAYNMEGAFNDLSLTLAPGVREPEVVAAVDRLLEPYGGLGAIPRELQISHWYLQAELQQLQVMGFLIPLVFLAVAAFLLNIVLSRIVSVQREQIAALKALGYSNVELASHYTRLTLLIAAGGALLGALAGAWLGYSLTELYNDFFRFPILEFRLSPRVVLGAVLVSLAAGAAGAFTSVRRAVKLPPAEAMRPEAPAKYRASLLERAGLQRFFSQPGRMIVRHIERQPVRSATAALGIAVAAALLIVGTFSIDAIDELMEAQFFVAQRQDLTVTFVEPLSGAALHELRQLPGALHAEPLRSVPVRLRVGHRSRQVAISGLMSEPSLSRIVDVSGGVLTLPPGGLVLSRKLAEILHAGVGDEVILEVLEGRRPVRHVPITGIVEEYMGLSAYMEIGALRRLVGEGDALSGAFLQIDAGREEQLLRRLQDSPRVAAVNLKRWLVQGFQETLAESLYIMILFNLIFSGIIAFGVVYNAARVSLAERSHELASLRVLGFTRGEISFILLGELAAITAVAIPIGLLLGYLMAAALVFALDTELYRFPLVVSARTYAASALAVLVATLISGLVVRRRLDRLDLVAVLKTKE